jgi:ubiquitin carboxyl-terminal hydrolase 16
MIPLGYIVRDAITDFKFIDCFINSVLQALAGLPDLRKYLIREIHRRKLDGPDVYKVTLDEVEGAGKVAELKFGKLEGLRKGIVTQALKEILDKLNERPIYRKTISAQEFVVALEYAFRTRISRQQQDAQEFLQVVTERLGDEYHAGQKARRKARAKSGPALAQALGMSQDEDSESTESDDTSEIPATPIVEVTQALEEESGDSPGEEGFPFEGQTESEIECDFCHFKPRPSKSTFVTLTLNVPQRNNTTLNSCFDGMLKVETIDDFKCDKCRLDHALGTKKRQLEGTTEPSKREKLESDISKIERALEDDPEKAPKDADLPGIEQAPKRRIRKHMRISSFPKILAVHLSRSIYSVASHSTKNMAKVSFPETLPLGSIVDQRKYRLLGLVTHKGGHNSGHYETFRRQVTSVPFSTPHNFGVDGIYSARGSPNPSVVTSPRLSAHMGSEKRLSSSLSQHTSSPDEPTTSSSMISTPPTLVSPSSSSLSSRSSLSFSSTTNSRFRHKNPAPTSAPRSEVPTATLDTPSPNSTNSPTPTQDVPSKRNSVRLSVASTTKEAKEKVLQLSAKRKSGVIGEKKKKDNRWWRISDDRVRECRTSEVLGMQKEVYLLFYELIRGEEE